MLNFSEASKVYLAITTDAKPVLFRKGLMTSTGIALKNICDTYGIPFTIDKSLELHWRLRNNDFEPRFCKHCGINYPVFKRQRFLDYCSTKCSARARPNSTRRGFVTKEGFDKSRHTMKEKYGVDHQIHVPEIHENQQSKRYKTYDIISPSGKLCRVQGYERYIIPHLWKIFHEDDIIVRKQDIPKILYYDENGKCRKYYPDAYIKSLNQIIEIKSTYTIKDPLLPYKINGCSQYNFKLYLYDRGKIIEYGAKEMIHGTIFS